MRKLLLVFSILLINISVLKSHEQIPYISPGIRIGWDFKKVVTLEPKISIGVTGIIPGFINVTFGLRRGIPVNKEIKYKTNYHIDFQMGRLSPLMGKRKVQLYYGGGIGLIVKEKEIIPRMTLFTGNFIFTTLDFSYRHRVTVDTDVGIQCVFPIPLIHFDNISIGG